MRRPALALLLLALAGGPLAAAPLPSLSHEAYRWRVVLAAGTHPAVGPAFRDQLGREVKAALVGAAGPVAAVEVIDLATAPAAGRDPLLAAFLEKGWAALDNDPRGPTYMDAKTQTLKVNPAALITEVKTHILKVDYRDGAYHLESRQHDGRTGLSPPLVRRQTVKAAEMVGRVAGMMLEPDFGPVGNVDFDPDNPTVATVQLQGAAIGSLDRYVKLGTIFAVSVIKETPKARPLPGKPVPPTIVVALPKDYTLLRVTEPVKDGSVKCQVLTRWRFPFDPPSNLRLGARALRLPTVESPVRVRLVAADGTPTGRGTLVQVTATETDFNAVAGPQDTFEFRDGLYRSGRAYAQVACVQVALGMGATQKFPIPVYGPDPVALRFQVKQEDEERAAFERLCLDLQAKVGEAAAAQATLFIEVSRLLNEGRNKDALKRAKDGLAATDQAHATLTAEMKVLRENPKAADAGAKAILQKCDDRLNGTPEVPGIKTAQAKLTGRLKEIEDAVAKSKDPIKLEKEFREKDLAEKIRDAVAKGDVLDALNYYDDLVKLRPTDQELKDRREKLQTEWAPKDEEHRKAREQLRVWRIAKTAQEYKEAVVELRAAAEAMLRKRDKLGLRQLQNSLEPAKVQIKAIADTLDANTDAGERDIKDLQTTTAEIVRVATDVAEYLKKLG